MKKLTYFAAFILTLAGCASPTNTASKHIPQFTNDPKAVKIMKTGLLTGRLDEWTRQGFPMKSSGSCFYDMKYDGDNISPTAMLDGGGIDLTFDPYFFDLGWPDETSVSVAREMTKGSHPITQIGLTLISVKTPRSQADFANLLQTTK